MGFTDKFDLLCCKLREEGEGERKGSARRGEGKGREVYREGEMEGREGKRKGTRSGGEVIPERSCQS